MAPWLIARGLGRCRQYHALGDGTVIGGDAVLTTHLFEKGILLLAPITIGRDCSVGAHALISPGVAVGDRATIGMRVILREGKRAPPARTLLPVTGCPTNGCWTWRDGGSNLDFRTGPPYLSRRQ